MLCFVVYLQLCNHNSEREEELADFKNMYLPRSPPTLIETDRKCPNPLPVSPERVLVCLPCVWGPCVCRADHLYRCWGCNLSWLKCSVWVRGRAWGLEWQVVSFKVEWVVQLGLKTKHSPSRSLVLYWCGSAWVTEEQLHPTEFLTHTISVTLLDYIVSLRRRVFSLWNFLFCGHDKEHTCLCALMIPREQAWLRVMVRSEGNKEGLSLCPALSILRTFRRTPTGQRSTPSFALHFSQFFRLERGH